MSITKSEFEDSQNLFKKLVHIYAGQPIEDTCFTIGEKIMATKLLSIIKQVSKSKK
jgi:hypothetical protein